MALINELLGFHLSLPLYSTKDTASHNLIFLQTKLSHGGLLLYLWQTFMLIWKTSVNSWYRPTTPGVQCLPKTSETTELMRLKLYILVSTNPLISSCGMNLNVYMPATVAIVKNFFLDISQPFLTGWNLVCVLSSRAQQICSVFYDMTFIWPLYFTCWKLKPLVAITECFVSKCYNDYWGVIGSGPQNICFFTTIPLFDICTSPMLKLLVDITQPFVSKCNNIWFMCSSKRFWYIINFDLHLTMLTLTLCPCS